MLIKAYVDKGKETIENTPIGELTFDGTSGLSHTEQLTFILTNFIQEEQVRQGKVIENFLTVPDFQKMKREDIACLILKILHKNYIEIKRCFEQDFDNALNVAFELIYIYDLRKYSLLHLFFGV